LCEPLVLFYFYFTFILVLLQLCGALRGVFTTRRYTNTHLPLPLPERRKNYHGDNFTYLSTGLMKKRDTENIIFYKVANVPTQHQHWGKTTMTHSCHSQNICSVTRKQRPPSNFADIPKSVIQGRGTQERIYEGQGACSQMDTNNGYYRWYCLIAVHS